MAYEYESDIPKFLKGIEYEHPLDLSKEIKEIQKVYRKAKAMDEIEQAYWKSNTPENFAYEFVRIHEEHFRRDKEHADDER